MMKTVILYFSGTGNNLYVAKSLAHQIKTTNLLSFKEFENGNTSLNDYERIIFCVPSYHSHIPNYVESVLRKMNFSDYQKIYTIVCCGGNRGYAVDDVREIVEEKGGRTIGEYMVKLPGSYIFMYNGFPGVLVKLEMFFSKFKISQIAKSIISGKMHIYRSVGLFYKESDEPKLKEAIRNYRNIGLEMQADSDCVACKTCEKVCPVNNITMKNHRPVFGDNCQQCMHVFNGALKKQLTGTI